MTILIETYKDEHTITAYYGFTLDNITEITLSAARDSLMFFSRYEIIATINTKLLKRLEICEDGK